MVLKELVDNALDACEAAGIAPVIDIVVDEDRISVSDNGSGIAPETVERILDYAYKTSSNAAYVSPTRGQQGNALQTLLAMNYALTGKPGITTIESRGVQHTISFDIDPISREPRLVNQRVDVSWLRPAAARITVSISPQEEDGDVFTRLQNAAFYFSATNPHLSLTYAGNGETLDFEATDPDWTKWKPTDPTSAHWYGLAALKGLIAAEVNKARLSGEAQRTVADFIGDFRGLAGTSKRRDICEAISASRQSLHAFYSRGDGDVRHLLDQMKAATRPVKPHDLGVIGEVHILTMIGGADAADKYKRVEIDVAGVPYLIEVGFSFRPGADHRSIFCGLNWSISVGGNPFRSLGYSGLGSILEAQRCSAEEPIGFFLHVASPNLTFTDRGKSDVSFPREVSSAIVDAIRKVTDGWAKQRKAEERDRQAVLRRHDAMTKSFKPMSITDAAHEVMAAAYASASDNGTLPANARQIFYAARPGIMRLAQVDKVDSGTFTQTHLVDYMNEHPEECAEWNVVFSDRGHFVEPHTGHVVGLGTLAVRGYVNGYHRPALIEGCFTDARVSTKGPEGRFNGLLYIEKEGFDPLLQAARIERRFDLASSSCKGMSVTAARELVDKTCARYGVPLYILHDFDIAGFSIATTLHKSNRRYQFSTASGDDFKVVDFGLRLDDVERLGLESEPVAFGKVSKSAIRDRLVVNGATEREIEFLLTGPGNTGQRVELNAMTSRQFVEYVEAKLIEQGVGKVVPDAGTLDNVYRLFVRSARAKRVVKQALAAMTTEAITPPADLEEQARAYLAEHPATSWDDAVAMLVGDDDDDTYAESTPAD